MVPKCHAQGSLGDLVVKVHVPGCHYQSDAIGPWYTWSVGLSLHGWQAAPGDSDSVMEENALINTGLDAKKSSFKGSEKK